MNGIRRNHINGFFLVCLKRFRQSGFLKETTLLVKLVDESFTTMQNVGGSVGDQREVFESEIVVVRIATCLHGIIFAA